ncbi:hypothetical protein FACS1894172_15710 [Spirochaetia bacterium]|nr:hypothetical protein FACS1894164_09600 [Spirochaetia bacterium]GHU34854.1 hypothetical protein FACS1894172_15710 [Spirochaetia bacterium]
MNDVATVLTNLGFQVETVLNGSLIPVDADIASALYLPIRALKMQTVIDELSGAENTVNIMVLDSDRINPFAFASFSYNCSYDSLGNSLEYARLKAFLFMCGIVLYFFSS